MLALPKRYLQLMTSKFMKRACKITYTQEEDYMRVPSGKNN